MYFLKSKDPAFNIFKTWKTIIENQTNKKVKKLRIENGQDYCSNNLKLLLQCRRNWKTLNC